MQRSCRWQGINAVAFKECALLAFYARMYVHESRGMYRELELVKRLP